MWICKDLGKDYVTLFDFISSCSVYLCSFHHNIDQFDKFSFCWFSWFFGMLHWLVKCQICAFKNTKDSAKNRINTISFVWCYRSFTTQLPEKNAANQTNSAHTQKSSVLCVTHAQTWKKTWAHGMYQYPHVPRWNKKTKRAKKHTTTMPIYSVMVDTVCEPANECEWAYTHSSQKKLNNFNSKLIKLTKIWWRHVKRTMQAKHARPSQRQPCKKCMIKKNHRQLQFYIAKLAL